MYPSHGYVERAAEFGRWEAAMLYDLDLYDSLQLAVRGEAGEGWGVPSTSPSYGEPNLGGVQIRAETKSNPMQKSEGGGRGWGEDGERMVRRVCMC